jgi:hypothetical protein
MSAGRRSGAMACPGAAVVLAVAIALDFADADAGAAAAAVIGASFAGVARLLRGIRRSQRLAAAAGNTTADRGGPAASRPGQRDPGASADGSSRRCDSCRAVAAAGGRAGHRIRERVGRRRRGVVEAEAAIDAASVRAGWDLLEIVHDRCQGGRCLERPGLSYALKKIASGEAPGLVVADVGHLCRSIVDSAR